MGTAAVTKHHGLTSGLRVQIGRFFAAIGRGLDTYFECMAQSKEIERLYSKSDTELARMGLKREEIPRHVFRNRLIS